MFFIDGRKACSSCGCFGGDNSVAMAAQSTEKDMADGRDGQVLVELITEM